MMKTSLFFLIGSLFSSFFSANSMESQTKILTKSRASVEVNNSDSTKSRASTRASDSVEQDNLVKPLVIENQDSAVTDIVKEAFEKFMNILKTKKLNSSEYQKAVTFFENSLYNAASFESLKLLSIVYEDREDFQNQIRVLNVLSISYPTNPESFYLLGRAYKNLLPQSDNTTSIREDMISNYNQALKLDPKHLPSYEATVEMLVSKDEKTQEEIHTKESLHVILDMIKSFKDSKYLPLLCKAYYDNKLFRQAKRACLQSFKKMPKDPIGPLFLSLTLKNKAQIEEKLILTAKEFPKSFFVNYKTGLYFKDHSPDSAIAYLSKAYQLKPDHLVLIKTLAQVLLENNREEDSYPYFKKACELTEGDFLNEFKKAKNNIRRKGKSTDLVVKFEKGITKCYKLSKDKKAKSKKN